MKISWLVKEVSFFPPFKDKSVAVYSYILVEKEGLTTFRLIEILKDYFELNFPLLKKVKKEGDLFVLLGINNKRHVYNYANKKVKLEMVIEDLTFFSGNKKAGDAMIEIEIKLQEEDTPNCEIFVSEIKKIFECTGSNQGKNTRGMSLLGIRY